MNLSAAASMPSRQRRPAVAALVDDILQRVHEIWDAAKAEYAAETCSPCAASFVSPAPWSKTDRNDRSTENAKARRRRATRGERQVRDLLCRSTALETSLRHVTLSAGEAINGRRGM